MSIRVKLRWLTEIVRKGAALTDAFLVVRRGFAASVTTIYQARGWDENQALRLRHNQADAV
jgi:hypothetical protein